MEKGKYIKKWLKRAGLTALFIPVLMVLLAVGVLYVPFTQRIVARKVISSIAESAGLTIHCGDFRLTYPLNLTLQDVYVIDASCDTIASIHKLGLELNTSRLLHKDVSIRKLYIDDLRFYSGALLKGIALQGVIGSLEGYAESISLANEEAILNRLKLLDADLMIRIDSIVQSDTAPTQLNWKVWVGNIHLERLACAVQMPADTIQINTFFEGISLTDGQIDLKEERYALGGLLLQAATVVYDYGEQPVKKGIDPAHLALTSLSASVDSILYQSEMMEAVIQSFTGVERSGLVINAMAGKVQMNETDITIPHFRVTTPYSSVEAILSIPREALLDNPAGNISTQLIAVVDKRDMELVAGDLPDMLAGLRQDGVLTVSCRLDGNRHKLYLQDFICAYTDMFQIDASGFMQDVTDSIMRSGTIDLSAALYGKALTAVVPSEYSGRFVLPDSVSLAMLASLQQGSYTADMLLSEAQGTIALSGTYNPLNEEYAVDFKADNMAPIHFFPQDSILSLTASFRAEGKGWDIFAGPITTGDTPRNREDRRSAGTRDSLENEGNQANLRRDNNREGGANRRDGANVRNQANVGDGGVGDGSVGEGGANRRDGANVRNQANIRDRAGREDGTIQGRGSNRRNSREVEAFSDRTRAALSGVLDEMQYGNIAVSGISFDGSLQNNKLQGSVTSTYPYVKGNITVDGNVQNNKLSGLIILDMETLDLQGLRITDKPFTNSFQIFSEFETDIKQNHQFDLTLGNWDMFLNDRTVSPKTMVFRTQTTEDTTRISLHAGDLGVTFTAGADIETVADQIAIVAGEVTRQLRQDTLIDFRLLRPLYPPMQVRIEAQNDNPVYNYLQNSNTFFERFYVNASVSPENGLAMEGMLLSLIKDTMKIDTIRMDIRQDTIGLNYALDIIKNRFRRQEAYQAGLKGSLSYGRGDMEMIYTNEQGTPGFHIGLRVEKQQDGVNLQVFPENPILAFLPFQVSDDNYVKIRNRKDIAANLRLTNTDNTSLWLHSIEENGRMQELLTEIDAIDLQKISNNILQIPSIQGLANLSVRFVPEDDTYMVVAETNVNNLVYQDEKVGDLLLNGVYLPLDDEAQQLDMHLFHDNQEIATLFAVYRSQNNEQIDGAFDVHTLPLSMLNPVLSGLAQLHGAFQSSMTVSGTAKQPLLNGYMQWDTASVYSATTGSRFRFDTKKVDIKDNTMRFDRFGVFAVGNNPLTVDGTIALNLTNPAASLLNLNMSANNMQLLDSRKTADNIVFGRMFIDLRNFSAKGTLSAPVVRGTLNVPGNTNMTLVMKESPLTVNDRMANLVTFTYFKDTIPRRRTLTGERIVRESRAVEGLDLLLAVHIEPAVKLTVELDDEGSNRVELEGGGDLSFRYTPQEDMLLTGRYALSGGLIKYNMPIIANKTLKIKENSYVDWSGDLMDPYLSVKATERIRTHVSTDDGQASRSVNFDAGIDVRQRMEDLSLQFTLEALDDQSLQNQLTALGAEERSKRAIGLLLTGLYLDEDKSGKIKLDMGTALNSFLQSEINQITGDLLKGVDFNFGMENYDRMGAGGTNYSFRFSKRFYNDRLNVVLGGNVTTGNLPNDNNTFINDASFEYRLDPGGSRYAKLFYKRQYESLLEGEITKYGGGVVFRKKIKRLGDLFLFGRKKQLTINN